MTNSFDSAGFWALIALGLTHFLWATYAVKRQIFLYPQAPLWKAWICFSLNLVFCPLGIAVAIVKDEN